MASLIDSKQPEKAQLPTTLAASGKPRAPVQDANEHQCLLDLEADADLDEALRQGLEDIAHGRTRPAREVFDKLRKEFGIPR